MGPPNIVITALVALIGCVVGVTATLPWWWCTAALAGAAPWLLLWPNGQMVLTVVAGLWMMAHGAYSVQTRPMTHLAHSLGQAESRPVHLEGVVADVTLQGCCIDITAQYAHGRWQPCTGTVGLVLASWMAAPQVGTHVRLLGRGRVTPQLDVVVEVHSDTHLEVVKPIDDVRVWARASVTAWPVSRGMNSTLIEAVTLGYRDRDFRTLAAPFRATGTSHILAVSGLHLAVLCGIVLIPARVLGLGPRPRAPLMAVIAALMTLVALPRVPLIRAASMAVLLALAGLWGRRIPAGSLLAIVLLVVLIAEPTVVRSIGFQLSFSVVAGLIWVLPAWMQRTRIAGIRPMGMVTALKATTVAWLVSMPLAIHHFGTVALLGIPATMLVLPMLGLVLACAFVRLSLGWIPGVDILAGTMLRVGGNTLHTCVEVLASLPGMFWQMPRPGWVWVLAVEAAVVTMLIASNPHVRRSARIAAAGLCGSVLFMDA